MDFLPPALAPLGAWPQFVCWVALPKPDQPGKLNKFPVDWQTGQIVDAHDPQFWTSAACALAMAAGWDRGYGSGAGFVFTDADPFFFADIDHAWDGSAWSPLAQQFCARLAGCAVEISQSQTGLHIIGRTAAIEHAKRNQPLGLELYTSKRFVALTGTNATGNAGHDATVPLAAIVSEFFPPRAAGADTVAEWTAEPVEGWSGPADDDELIRRALAASGRSAAAAFGAPQPTFADLWHANADVLAARWPGEGSKPYGQSEADQALANMLAFWTGKNCERMAVLMNRSALVRDKWAERRQGGTYLMVTILNACSFVLQVYSQQTQQSAPIAAVMPVDHDALATAATETGRELRDATREYLGPVQQLDHFAGCYYDNATEKVYSVPKNALFGRSSFDVNFGGHLFIMDPQGQAKPSKSAWEAFTESRVNVPPIVDGLCFRPECPQGSLIIEGRRRYVNSFAPHMPRRIEGDASKFFTHLEKLLPDAGDRLKLLTYMASMAQNPGRKFQWWPVLQGAEGNGKTLILSIMSHAMGQEYTHMPNTQKLAKQGINFNSWLYRKLFLGMEEIYMGNRRDFLEEIKPYVTNERLEIEGKGANQFMGDNRANGIMCTNHRDGVPVTTDSRRYAIFFTAQQKAEDIQRDGMGGEYFYDLWNWVKGEGEYAAGGPMYGAAIVADVLLSMTLDPLLDPARLATRAPTTTSTAEALLASLGRAEQEILDAVDEGKPGFAGGWVSSTYLDALLDQIRAHVPRSKRREMMRSLGYDYHPGLIDGRVNNAVMPDARKPRLYMRRDNPDFTLSNPSDIAARYTAAQLAAGQNATTSPSPAAIAFQQVAA